MSKYEDALRKIQQASQFDPELKSTVPVDGKRHAARRRCIIEAVAFIDLHDGSTCIRQGAVRNISEGGMLFEFSKPLSKNSHRISGMATVTVKFRTDSEFGPEYEVEGEVVHAKFSETTFLGIRFNKPFDEALFIHCE